MTTKALTVRLDPEDYTRLETAAKDLGVLPGTLARMLIKGSLAEPERDAERALRSALERSAALRHGLNGDREVDAVELVRRGRDDLDRRTSN